jgi:protein-tyrosine-phosphatase
MVAALNYTGIAMFEFRVNHKAGTWALLEVNARPWGSLPLPVALGVDFPYRWYQLLVEGEETPARDYKVGVYGRNFVPDFGQMSAQAWGLRRKPLELMKFCGRAVAEYARVFMGREVGDVLAFDDPKPALWEVGGLFYRLLQHFASEGLGAIGRLRQRDIQAVRRAIARRKRGGVTIAFVCQGNICRSPVAARLFQRYVSAEAHRVRAVSAGMLPRMGVPSPAAAIEAARELNVVLTDHHSQHFSRKLAESATAIVVFDETNQTRIMDRYPSLTAPVVMLGSFGDNPHRPVRIADPDGGDVAKFRATYSHVDEAVKGLAKIIRAGLD